MRPLVRIMTVMMMIEIYLFLKKKKQRKVLKQIILNCDKNMLSVHRLFFYGPRG